MLFIKALFAALADVFKLWANIGKLTVELFWCLMGIIGLILSVVLLPVIVCRKYAQFSAGATKKKKVGKHTRCIKKCRTA